MQAKPLDLTETQLDKMMSTIDTNKDGGISQEEFSSFFFAVLRNRFESFDTDNSGTLNGGEIDHFIDMLLSDKEKDLKKKDKNASERLRKHYKSKVDTDGDLSITLDEFESFICLEIKERLDKNEGLPQGIRNLVDLNVSHLKVEEGKTHSEGVKGLVEQEEKVVKPDFHRGMCGCGEKFADCAIM